VIRRSALVVLGNTALPSWGRQHVVDLISPRLQDENPMLRDHAVWAARRLGLDLPLPVCCASVADSPSLSHEAAVDVEIDGATGCQDPELHLELVAPVEARFSAADWEVP